MLVGLAMVARSAWVDTPAGAAEKDDAYLVSVGNASAECGELEFGKIVDAPSPGYAPKMAPPAPAA